jgi:hypothetical protein
MPLARARQDRSGIVGSAIRGAPGDLLWPNPAIWSGLTLPVSLKLCTHLIGMLMPPKMGRRLMQRQAAFDNRLRHIWPYPAVSSI